MGTSHVNINGMNFVIRNNKVYINGKLMVPAGSDPTSPEPSWEEVSKGYQVSLDTDGAISGNVQGDLTINVTGSLHLVVNGEIEGSLRLNGPGTVSVNKNVGGSIKSEGPVSVGMNVGGSVKSEDSVRVGGHVGGSCKGKVIRA